MSSDKMRAALIYSTHNLRIEEVEIPKIEKDEVLIKVSACGVCATDVKKYSGQAKLAKVPLITGHEFTGEVVDAGKIARKSVSIGSKVVVNPVILCDRCYFCRSGKAYFEGVALCQNYKVIGHSIDGAFAEYVKVPFKNIYELPKSSSLITSTIIEPVACCLHGVNLSEVGIGDKILIVGAGFMGLVTARIAKLKGAEVFIVDLIQDRLNAALRLGVDEAINPSAVSLTNIFLDLTNGIGLDAIIFTIGGKKVIENYIPFIRKGGKVVLLASTFPETKIEIDPNFIHYNLITIKGSVSYSISEFVESINLVTKGLINPKDVITDILSLDKIEEAFISVENKKGLRKIILFDKEVRNEL